MARKNKKVHAPTTTNPAKMGEEMAHPTVTAAQSPNLKYRPRGGPKGGPEPATAGSRKGFQTDDNRVPQTPERLGAKWAPQMMMHSPNPAVGAQETQKNVRILPSALGQRDFYYKRQYGQVQQ